LHKRNGSQIRTLPCPGNGNDIFSVKCAAIAEVADSSEFADNGNVLKPPSAIFTTLDLREKIVFGYGEKYVRRFGPGQT